MHVLTTARPVGGHTRTVLNWILTDAESEHYVVITQQGLAEVPLWLRDAAMSSGGELQLLDNRRGLIRIAKKLRQAAADVDLIILHVHPSDVVPSLAFGATSNHPPIALFNHADHVFWVGATSSDVVVNCRESGARLTRDRRGVPTGRTALLPLPLAGALRLRPKIAARASLGLDGETVLVLSVASNYKFVPTEYGDFAQTHARVLERYPNVMFVVVGADPTLPYWRRWANLSGGRLKAVGLHADTSDFFSAADIYCDSIPMGSCTSLLEAGSAGIPCVSWSPYPQESALLSSDDVAFEGHDIQYSDQNLYVEQLASLVSGAHRADAGAALRNAIAHAHTGHGWLKTLNELYSTLPEQVAQRPHQPTSKPDAVGLYDGILAGFQETYNNFKPFIPGAAPLRLKLALKDSCRPSPRELVESAIPNPVLRGLRNIFSRVRRKPEI
jgi:hypothetical protein